MNIGATLPSQLRLSHEHQGWRFEPDAMKAVDLLIDHSGGKVSNALEMAVGQGEIVIAKGELDTSNVLEKYVKDDYRAFVFAIHPSMESSSFAVLERRRRGHISRRLEGTSIRRILTMQCLIHRVVAIKVLPC